MSDLAICVEERMRRAECFARALPPGSDRLSVRDYRPENAPEGVFDLEASIGVPDGKLLRRVQAHQRIYDVPAQALGEADRLALADSIAFRLINGLVWEAWQVCDQAEAKEAASVAAGVEEAK